MAACSSWTTRAELIRFDQAFQRLAGQLVPALPAAFRDQLDRASLSILLNLAEGVGRSQPADKARFYAISRGSAMECAALIDAACGRGLADAPRCAEAKASLLRIVQMTTRLQQAMMRKQVTSGSGTGTGTATGG